MLACVTDVTTFSNRLKMFDPHIVNGQRVHMETSWLPTLDRRGVDAMLGAIWSAVSPGCAILTHDFRGAATRVAPDATAFGLRREHVMIEILASCDPRDGVEAEHSHHQWAQGARHAFNALALPGGYPNLLGRDDGERAAVSFGPNADRLMRAKQKFDPDNV